MASDKWNEILNSAGTSFTWLNTINDGPSPIICPDDAHGEVDLTSELDSVFAKLQKNIKRLQNRINFVDSINRKLYDEWTKAEMTANDIERENQQLRIENSRLVKEASRANRKSTVELVRDEFVGGWTHHANTGNLMSPQSTTVMMCRTVADDVMRRFADNNHD
ncbi:hypothetical protein V500_02948 [Pseudogymnoascus sp. VKM F-4518 (FW-2643)]|nr:hypothetical protein V500_02948 [Pseudogymnoascus sp. VKM F-4518 (FW-2643)]